MLMQMFRKNLGAKDDSKHLVESIDLVAAISDHMKWKSVLQDCINNKVEDIEEHLNHEIVCWDDQCVLGKWLHGDSQNTFSRYNSFDLLKNEHAKFHQLACRVIHLVDANEMEDAALLISGEFNQALHQVIKLISKLNADVQDGINMRSPEYSA